MELNGKDLTNAMGRHAFWTKVLRVLDSVGRTWFILCTGYILMMTLRGTGFGRWAISGSAVLVLLGVLVLLVGLHLVTRPHRAGRAGNYAAEHPFTSCTAYKVFYAATPFLGGIATCILGILDTAYATRFTMRVALSTFGTTFLVWVIFDPIVLFCEKLIFKCKRTKNVSTSV